MSGDGPISYKPTEGMSYDPSEARYWEPAAVAMETTRIFEVCHGCRMCFKFCDSFPTLFSLLDEQHDGDVRKLTGGDVDRVVDQCFQCKLCEVQCPYTPREGHEFAVDFPRLMHRHRAIRARHHGTSLRDKVLGDPDRVARLARATFGLANVANRLRPQRWLLEKVLGIHRDKDLPEFAGTTFEKWAKDHGKVGLPPGTETVLFPTCTVNNNEPQVGRDTLDVFDRNQVPCAVVPGLACCGMPAWEHGDLDTVRANARHNLDLLAPHVAAGSKVVVLQPTCAMMLRNELPELVEGPDRERAKALAAAVVDPSEHLWSIRKEERFNTDFQSTPGGTIAYHAPCHLRAQRAGFRGRELLKKIPGTKVEAVLECCGHDGTYAMTVEGFEPSQRIGKTAFDQMKQADAAVWSSECALASVQFKQHAGRAALHPMTVLAKAYRKDGFANRLPGPVEGE